MSKRNVRVSRKVAFSAEVISGQASETSDPIRVDYAENFSYIAEITGSNKDIKVEIQIIASLEGDADNVSTGKDSFKKWITPENGVIIPNLTADKAGSFSVPVSQWIRVKLTGNLAGTSAAITLYILYQ